MASRWPLTEHVVAPSCLTRPLHALHPLGVVFPCCTSAGGIGGPEELAMLFQGVMIDTVYFDAPGCSRQGWCHCLDTTIPALPLLVSRTQHYALTDSKSLSAGIPCS